MSNRLPRYNRRALSPQEGSTRCSLCALGSDQACDEEDTWMPHRPCSEPDFMAIWTGSSSKCVTLPLFGRKGMQTRVYVTEETGRTG